MIAKQKYAIIDRILFRLLLWEQRKPPDIYAARELYRSMKLRENTAENMAKSLSWLSGKLIEQVMLISP